MSKPIASIEELQSQLSSIDGGRYKLERIIGKGSYGVVVQAFDNVKEKRVAIKRVAAEIFKDSFLSLRILREISMMAHFRHHRNIMGVIDIVKPPTTEFDVLYIVMDIMDADLKSVMKSGQALLEYHVQFFIYQILCGLLYIHKSGVIHRDITPANLLVNTDCDLRICDFGLARPERQAETELTDYVVMRWYRAPELVMEDTNYTAAVDVWACGCVLGQLLTKGFKPIFPGQDRIKQLGAILQIIGTPTDDDIARVGSQAAQKYLKRHYPNYSGVKFEEYFQTPEGNPLSHEALDLLQRMLIFNPEKRITVEEAMRHPYLKDLYEEEDELPQAEPFNLDLTGYDTENVEVLKRLIYYKVQEVKQVLLEDEAQPTPESADQPQDHIVNVNSSPKQSSEANATQAPQQQQPQTPAIQIVDRLPPTESEKAALSDGEFSESDEESNKKP